jgi:hypothetical protein
MNDPSVPPLTPIQSASRIREEIIERLKAKGEVGHCTICQQNRWVVGKYAPIRASSSPVDLILRDNRVFPLVTVYCDNCGHTLFVNLIHLGYTDKDWARLTFPD